MYILLSVTLRAHAREGYGTQFVHQSVKVDLEDGSILLNHPTVALEILSLFNVPEIFVSIYFYG